MHTSKHPLAGQTVILNENTVTDVVQGLVVGGAAFTIEDWADRVYGYSWMDAGGNLSAMHYAIRSSNELPLDDDVVYGKIFGLGNIVHVSELGSTLV